MPRAACCSGGNDASPELRAGNRARALRRFRASVFGFRVSGLVFWAWCLEFWVSGFGFGVSGFGFRVSGLVSREGRFGFRGWCFGTRVDGLVFPVWFFGFQVSSPGGRAQDSVFRQVSGSFGMQGFGKSRVSKFREVAHSGFRVQVPGSRVTDRVPRGADTGREHLAPNPDSNPSGNEYTEVANEYTEVEGQTASLAAQTQAANWHSAAALPRSTVGSLGVYYPWGLSLALASVPLGSITRIHD